jgi:hypothetical protein
MNWIKKSTFAAVFATASLFATAQQETGKISYTITFDTDDPQMKMQMSMMGSSEMTTWFNKDKLRQEMNMGGFSIQTTITDGTQRKKLLLIDVPMQGMKMAVPGDITEDDNLNEKVEVEVTDEMVEIAGYKCRKYIIADEDGNEIILYATEDLKVSSQGTRFSNSKVKGFPLKIVMDQTMFKMVIEATKVEQKYKEKDKELYNLEVPEDYEIGTEEDLRGMRGG